MLKKVDSRLFNYLPLDLDADSQTEAPAGLMSGIDTDSDSDGNENAVDNQLQVIDNEEPIETPYIAAPEEEINTVNMQQIILNIYTMYVLLFIYMHMYMEFLLINVYLFIFQYCRQLANKWKN